MNLPFTREQFLDVFAAYHRSFGLVALLLWITSAAVLVAWWRGRIGSRPLAALLAFHWLWAGLAYHAWLFTRINPAARLFAALFVLEALLLARAGLARHDLRFEPHGPRPPLAAFFAGAALLYPLLAALATGDPWRSPTFGVPCPTVLLTAGVLFAAAPPVPRSVLLIPILWALLAGSAAWQLGMLPDLLLFGAAAVLITAALRPRGTTTRTLHGRLAPR